MKNDAAVLLRRKRYNLVNGLLRQRAFRNAYCDRAMTCDEALERIRHEYREMPDLKLTLPQVRRLCDLPQGICESAVNTLLGSGFLQRATSGNLFLARQEEPATQSAV
jgi:hypothetical protein